MPEGDVVWHAAARLNRALTGKVLTTSDFRVPRYATLDLRGQTVDETVSRGKHLLTRIGRLTVHTHLKMEGVWRVYTPGQRWNRPAHQARLILANADQQAVGFALGTVEVLPRDEEHRAVGHLGPDLLGADWDPDEAIRRLLSAPERPVGLALLDQSNLAGIGNIYRSEICWAARVDPRSPVGEVADLPALMKHSHEVLMAATHHGPWRVQAYQRRRMPCRRCDSGIESAVLSDHPTADRQVYFCPKCQH
jgi:endonuclease-8